MQSTYTIFKKTIAQLCPPKSKILVGISGGVDSTLLLHFFKKYSQEYPVEIVAGHFIHNWPERKEEEKIELEVCKNQSLLHEIPLFIGDSNSYILPEYKRNKSQGSKEGIARQERRFFLERVAEQNSCTFIALAHHKDDQIETFFIRLMRGASVSGLECIKYKTSQYIHPLLDIPKKDIYKTAVQEKYEFYEDKTNKSSLGLRNKIRNELIPVCQKIDGRFESSCIEIIRKISECNQAIEYTIAPILEKIYNQKENSIDLDLFFEQPIYFQKIIIEKLLIRYKIDLIVTEKILLEIIRFFENGSNKKEHPIKNVIFKKSNINKVIIINL